MTEFDRPADGRDDEFDDSGTGLEYAENANDGILATDAEGGPIDFSDEDEPILDETDTEPVTVEDFKGFHSAVHGAMTRRPDALLPQEQRGTFTSELMAREEDLPSEARRLLARIPVDSSAELVDYRIRHVVADAPGNPVWRTDAQFLRREFGEGVTRLVDVTYTVRNDLPVNEGEREWHAGWREVHATTWLDDESGKPSLPSIDEAEGLLHIDQEFRLTYDFTRGEMNEVVRHLGTYDGRAGSPPRD